jgi:microcystin-dependent protein
MDGTIAEIRMFGGNFAPRDWAFCQGQILSIAQNTALFSLLGTTYGGNGQTTFALPDFRGRSAFGTGQGPGLANISLGEVSGTESVTLIATQLPVHTHPVTPNGVYAGGKAERPGPLGTPVSNYYSILPGANHYSTTSDGNMAPIDASGVLSTVGASQPFSNRMPYLGLSIIICLFGIFPSRN